MDSRRSSSLNVALSHFVILARKFKAGIVGLVALLSGLAMRRIRS